VAAIERRYASGSAPGADEARVKSVVPVAYRLLLQPIHPHGLDEDDEEGDEDVEGVRKQR
jgi:hypothetical protein